MDGVYFIKKTKFRELERAFDEFGLDLQEEMENCDLLIALPEFCDADEILVTKV